MEVVQRALRNAIFDLNAALDVLLVRELNFFIENFCVVPFIRSRTLHHPLIFAAILVVQ